MRRRITEAIVGVSALILLVLGVPLAIVAHQSILDAEVVELQATAARALAEIDVPFDAGQLAEVAQEADAPPPFAVYDATGRLVFGDGPPSADGAVVRALAGSPASSTSDEIVVATPILERTSERIVGALRITESMDGADHRSRVAWALMAATAILALGLAWLIAKRVARRLSQPITDLVDATGLIGDGGTVPRRPASGIEEIDVLADAFVDTSERVSEVLARERRFSADVSHQLRTPLTAIRLRLEAAHAQGDTALVEPALHDLQRLEQTVDHLLAFARDSMPATSTVSVDASARGAAERWAARASAAGRHVVVTTTEPTSARGSTTSIDQVLDVLLDNALHHGAGYIAITQRRIAGGAAIDVADRGMIEPADAERIFERGHGDHNGIGLALARSITEAEGGRLLLARHEPTTFSIILLEPEPKDAS